MNQILDFETEKRGKAPKQNSTRSDKIVKIFAIALMVFAVLLIGSGVYSLVINNSDDDDGDTLEVAVEAEINAIMDESNEVIILTVESEIEIDKVIYNWNTNTEMTIDGEDSKTFEKSIDLPSGTNTLNVKVIDNDGNETSKSFDFESEEGNDIINPDITLEVTEDKNLLITATDETEMSFLTYRWNDEEETTVNVDEDSDDKTTITVEIEIPKGTNTITVVAVDASSKHNTRTETKTLTGVTKPEITYNLSEDGVLTFFCTHESGIKEIYYTLNGESYGITYTEEEGYPTSAEFDQTLEVGYNEIYLVVTSIDDTEQTFEGTCTIEDDSEAESSDTNETDSENTTE